jgi:hypothetical protein
MPIGWIPYCIKKDSNKINDGAINLEMNFMDLSFGQYKNHMDTHMVNYSTKNLQRGSLMRSWHNKSE